MEHKTLFIIALSLDLSEFIHSFYLFNCLGRLNIYFVGLNQFIMKNVSFIALNNGSTASPWLSIARLVVVGLCVGDGEFPHLPCRPTQDPPSHVISPPPPPPPNITTFECSVGQIASLVPIFYANEGEGVGFVE